MTAQHFSLFVSIDGDTRPATGDEIIAAAHPALDAKIKRQGNITSPADARGVRVATAGQPST